MESEIWRKNFEIKRTHFQMATPALYDMMTMQNITLNRRILTEGVWVQEGYDNTGTYFKREELRSLINKTLEVILENPNKIDAIHKKTLKYNREFFIYAEDIRKKDIRSLTNKELSIIYLKWTKLLIYSHGWALPTTWFIDSDGEDFSKLLLSKIKDLIKINKSTYNYAEVFSILTTPMSPSFAMKEEIESLKVVRLIKKNGQAKKLFLQKDVKKIENNLDKINKKIKQKIFSHFNKWRWVPYTYMGPDYNLDYYLEIWSGIIRQKIDINKELKRLEIEPERIKNKKRQLESKLKISAADKHLLKIAADIIYLKAYRKDCWFHGCFVAENLYKEIGRRLGLSLNQVWMMGWWEVAPALAKGKFNSEILNERLRFSILYQAGEKGKIYTGRKAKDFLKSLTLEKVKIVSVDKLSGTAAYAGRAKGKVRIINLPEEMGKMEKGNIMVAHTTFPSLVPAMKKAAAIVTDDGGITSHAAIVARELKIPCVVGTKIATQVLKDGDLVEVDADKGTVRKINS